MEVKIGVRHAPRELMVDVTESADEVQAAIAAALTSDDGVLTLTDAKGRRILVPGRNIAYVELGTGTSGTVGFRS
jgi:hypothetical protein